MNTRIFTRAALFSYLLSLLATAGFAQSNDIIDAARVTFQNAIITETLQQAWVGIDTPCKSSTWDNGVALVAKVEGVENLSLPEVLGGNDLMFVYLSEEETGQGSTSSLPNGFYTVSIHRATDGTRSYTAQFKDAADKTVAEAPAEVSRMIMDGATPGVDVAVEHSERKIEWSVHVCTNKDCVWIKVTIELSLFQVAKPSRAQGYPIREESVKGSLQQNRERVAVDIDLEESYPNPFNPTTTLRFSLPETMPVTLRVYDLQGRAVATLVEGVREAGTHTVQFDGTHLASGTYLYRLEAGAYSQTKRFTLVK
jgi:hypothetical protein